jgi:hypothetical protein
VRCLNSLARKRDSAPGHHPFSRRLAPNLRKIKELIRSIPAPALPGVRQDRPDYPATPGALPDALLEIPGLPILARRRSAQRQAMRGKITKRKVDELQSRNRDVFLCDTDLPSFGYKITPKGGRIYVLQYG